MLKEIVLAALVAGNCLPELDPRLAEVVTLAGEISRQDFRVQECRRTPERQIRLYQQGRSWTLCSKHLHGDAVDLVVMENGEPVWRWEAYEKLARAMKQAARELGVDIEWGGDWRERDGMHFELAS